MSSDKTDNNEIEKSKTDINETEQGKKRPSIQQKDFNVRVFWDEKKCDEFVEKGFWPAKGTVILGFDAEYTREDDVAMIQLCDANIAVLVKLAYVNPRDHDDKRFLPMPRSIRAILEDSKYIKAGVGVHSDAQALLTQYSDVVVSGLLDVSSLAVATGITGIQKSLGDLSLDLLGIPKSKSCGGWAYHHMLTPDQAKYASYDAWTSLKVAEELYKTLKNENEEVAEWCNRAIDIAEPYVEEHVRNSQMGNDIIYVQGKARRNVRNSDTAPQRVKEKAAERRKLNAQNGVVRGKLSDIRKKKEKFKSDEKAIDDALNELKECSSSAKSHRKQDQPPKKKPKPSVDVNGDDDDGMQMNFF